MQDGDQVYGGKRAERLIELLRALASRIEALDRAGGLLDAAPELQRMLGDVRSELFHYEVRRTYDTPELAEGRRIVEEAQREFTIDLPEEDEPWRQGPAE
jgi:hypothetical protein